jgi:hypothetical protein
MDPGQVAQLVEQGTENPRVGGSIPSLATSSFPSLGCASLRAPAALAEHRSLRSAGASLRAPAGACDRASTRSLAAVLFGIVALFAAGCGDRCETLCDDVADQLARCRPDNLTWGDLGAVNKRDWASGCRRDWDDVSGSLSARDLELALDVCDDGQAQLQTLSCEEIVALYAE